MNATGMDRFAPRLQGACLHACRSWTRGLEHAPLVWLAMAAVLQVAFFLCGIGDAVFWRDEAHAVAIATLPFDAFLRVLVSDWHPFSHLIVLRMWCWVVGTGEVPVRALALVCMIASLCVYYRAGVLWLEDRTSAACLSVFLHISSVALFSLNATVKPYPFALLANGVVWLTVAHLGERWSVRMLWWFWGAAIFSLNSQPVNFAFHGGLLLAYLTRIGWANRRVWMVFQRAVLLAAVSVLAGLPTVIQAIRYQGIETGDGSVSMSQFTIRGLLGFMLNGLRQVADPLYLMISYLTNESPPEHLLQWGLRFPNPVVVLGAAIAGFLVLYVLHHMVRGSGWSLFTQLTVMFVVTMGLLWLAGFANDRMVMRFKNYSSLGPAAVLGALLIVRAFPRLMITLLLAGLLRMSIEYAAVLDRTGRGRRSDGDRCVHYIQERVQTSDALLLVNTAIAPTFNWYSELEVEQRDHPYDGRVRYWNMMSLWAHQGEEARILKTVDYIRDVLRAGRRLWMVGGGTPEPMYPKRWYSADELPLFLAAAQDHGELIEHVHYDKTLEPFTLWLYQPVEEIELENSRLQTPSLSGIHHD